MEELNDKISIEELPEDERPLHEGKIRENENDDGEGQPKENEEGSVHELDEEGNLIEHREQGGVEEEDIGRSGKFEEEEQDRDKEKGNESKNEKEDSKQKDGEEIKKPLNDSTGNFNQDNKESSKSKEGEVFEEGDKNPYRSPYYPNLHYDYHTMGKGNDYLSYSNKYERMPYTYSLQNSTNYLSINDRYSSFRSNKEPVDEANMRQSYKSDKDEELVEKTKKVLNESNSNNLLRQDDSYAPQRSFSSFNRTQPERSYISSYDKEKKDYEVKQIEDIGSSPLGKYQSPSKGEWTYSLDSSTKRLAPYSINPRIEAIKDKYRFASFKSNRFEPSTMRNKYAGSLMKNSYQYELKPHSRIGSNQTKGSYLNFDSINRLELNYSTRCLHDKCYCHCRAYCHCHCRRSLFI